MVIYSDNNLHVVVCDVGQGDGIYIRTPGGQDVVLDGGPDSKILECLSTNMPFWDRKIDVVFLSHGHSDHVTGLIDVFSRYEVGHFVTQDDLGEGDVLEVFSEELSMRGVSTRLVSSGDVIRVGEIVFRVVWPSDEFLESTDDTLGNFDKNVTSLTMILSYGSVDFLLTGDVEESVVRDILSRSDVDVLKVAHQGSYTGTGSETFSVQSPEFAVISVGKNSYGHPHPVVIQALEQRQIPYLRTDRDGSIDIVSDGKRFWVRK